MASAGAFNGIGRTRIPAAMGIILNFLRVPGALILSSMALGMTGVWWSMSISAVLKGLILTSLFVYMLKKVFIRNNYHFGARH